MKKRLPVIIAVLAVLGSSLALFACAGSGPDMIRLTFRTADGAYDELGAYDYGEVPYSADGVDISSMVTVVGQWRDSGSGTYEYRDVSASDYTIKYSNSDGTTYEALPKPCLPGIYYVDFEYTGSEGSNVSGARLVFTVARAKGSRYKLTAPDGSSWSYDSAPKTLKMVDKSTGAAYTGDNSTVYYITEARYNELFPDGNFDSGKSSDLLTTGKFGVITDQAYEMNAGTYYAFASTPMDDMYDSGYCQPLKVTVAKAALTIDQTLITGSSYPDLYRITFDYARNFTQEHKPHTGMVSLGDIDLNISSYSSGYFFLPEIKDRNNRDVSGEWSWAPSENTAEKIYDENSGMSNHSICFTSDNYAVTGTISLPVYFCSTPVTIDFNFVTADTRYNEAMSVFNNYGSAKKLLIPFAAGGYLPEFIGTDTEYGANCVTVTCNGQPVELTYSEMENTNLHTNTLPKITQPGKYTYELKLTSPRLSWESTMPIKAGDDTVAVYELEFAAPLTLTSGSNSLVSAEGGEYLLLIDLGQQATDVDLTIDAAGISSAELPEAFDVYAYTASIGSSADGLAMHVWIECDSIGSLSDFTPGANADEYTMTVAENCSSSLVCTTILIYVKVPAGFDGTLSYTVNSIS